MTRKAHGQIRRSQAVTTWGPGALLDLPRHSAIVGGLETWPPTKDLDQIEEPRLTARLTAMTGVAEPALYAPPAASDDPRAPGEQGIRVWRFPEWFVVQEAAGGGRDRSRRLVHRTALDERGRFDRLDVVPTRFVRACPNGHIDDLDWYRFVHASDDDACRQQLWLDERGTTGDLADLVVRCACGASQRLAKAAELRDRPLGCCNGARPWLGRHAEEPKCGHPSRLLIRTASNAYFPQVVRVLSLPARGAAMERVVRDLWEDLQIVHDAADLAVISRKGKVAQALQPFAEREVLDAIRREAIRREAIARRGDGSDNGTASRRNVKQAELEALLAAPEGFGDDAPTDRDFHARRLPDEVWRTGRGQRMASDIASVIQLHRLREVLALIGFTRLEAVTPDTHGEYETDVRRADLALKPEWFPAIENHGEGVFVQVRADAITRWQQRPAVAARLADLQAGHDRWMRDRKTSREFPGGPYVLLHTLSHLLIQSLALRCGYPASSIRERIYAEEGPDGAADGQFGLLLYTGSPDADGTLGGLVQQARHFEHHLADALQAGMLCSHDPICAGHAPSDDLDNRWLHGAACHGCTLIAETSCEMRNDYLDRALVVPVLGREDAAFFPAPA